MIKNPFKHHRFPPQIILLTVRWYCRYPLSYRDVRDLLAERGIHVDPSTINRWVPGKGFQSLRTAKPTLLGIEAFRTIKRGDLFEPPENARAELRLVNQMFRLAT